LEGNREQADPEQVTHSGQVRDRRVIGIDLPFPHPVDHNVSDVEERRYLQHRRAKINEDEERRHRRVAVLNVIDQVDENDVAWYHHHHQDPCRPGVHTCGQKTGNERKRRERKEIYRTSYRKNKEIPFPKKLAIGVIKITGCVSPGGIRSVPSSACL